MSVQPQDFLIIGTLIVLEGLLSADNALVLALLVRHLPREQQHKALLYGLIGAFVLRGIGIAIAGYIIRLWWLCAVGAVYLIWLGVKHFAARGGEGEHEVKPTGPGFWHTVAVVELTDIVFAVDSILVAVALVNDPSKIWIVYTGGFLGIVLLRMAAGFFIKLIRRYPSLDNMAYALVAWAGVKLASTAGHLYTEQYGGSLPELPKPVFWAVFALIVVGGTIQARRQGATTPDDKADAAAADAALESLEEKDTVGDAPPQPPHAGEEAAGATPAAARPGDQVS